MEQFSAVMGGPNKKGIVAMLLEGDHLMLPGRKHKCYVIEKIDYENLVAYVRPLDDNGEPMMSEPLEEY